MTSENPTTQTQTTLDEKRKQCLLCPLPEDFLRILPYHEDLYARGAVSRSDRFLELIIVEARLAKNYGLTSMNPYCRIRLGDARYETQASINGSKHPVWRELCRLPLRDDSHLLSVVVMDEGFVLGDSKIAWTTIPLPQTLLSGSLVDMWYDLTGKKGQVEGSIHLSMRVRTVLQLVPGYKPSSVSTLAGQPVQPPPRVSPPTGPPPQQIPVQPPVQISPEDIQAIKEVFPHVADDTIQALLETHGGNRDAVTGELLRMTAET